MIRCLLVLNDIVKTMFSSKFMEELFKPQEMYTGPSTKQVFDRLAHSSIMRLNSSSMDKVDIFDETRFPPPFFHCSLLKYLLSQNEAVIKPHLFVYLLSLFSPVLLTFVLLVLLIPFFSFSCMT